MRQVSLPGRERRGGVNERLSTVIIGDLQTLPRSQAACSLDWQSHAALMAFCPSPFGE